MYLFLPSPRGQQLRFDSLDKLNLRDYLVMTMIVLRFVDLGHMDGVLSIHNFSEGKAKPFHEYGPSLIRGERIG